MSGIFDTFGFANCFSPDDLPVWGEYIWYSYEDLFLRNNAPDLELQIDRVEQIWTKASYSYIQEGMAYSIIKVYKLYKKLGFKDFKEYCLKRVKKTTWRVEHIIKAAQTAWNLMVAGFNELPSNVSQAYALYEPLVKKGCDYDVEEAWENILCRSQEENTAITAGLIEATVSPEKKRKRSKIKLPEEVMALLRKKAEEKGQDPEDLAAEIISEYFAVEQYSDPDTETVAEPESIDNLKGCVSKTPEIKAWEQYSDPDTETVAEPESIDNLKGCVSKTPEIKAWEIDLQNLVQEKYTNKSNFETTADSSAIPGGCQSDGDIFSGGQVRRPPT